MDGDADYGFFKSHRGAKKPECLDFVIGVKHHAEPWRLSGSRTFLGDTIVIHYPDCKVTIKGKGLAELWGYILRERVYVIYQADPSDISLNDRESYVESIAVQDNA